MEKVKVSRAILFGSQAKGTSKKEGDIDVVIVSNAFEHKVLILIKDAIK